jgi:hypothetical protein
MHTTYPTHPFFLDLIILTIHGQLKVSTDLNTKNNNAAEISGNYRE